MKTSDLPDYITAANPTWIAEHRQQRDELTMVTTPEQLVALLTFLRDDAQCLFKQLIDVSGVDYPERTQRFEVVYQLLSLKKNLRLTVKVMVDEHTDVPSVTDVFPAAGWFEREAFDMYGIQFSGHPDLRRILTDYGFEGHPQRKDFPLTGFTELRYDATEQKVISEPVKLAQAYRDFDFLSPWESSNA